MNVRESTERSVEEALRDHLRGRTTLLVLDNLEQLLPAGAETVARIVRDAPDLRVIVTSRELLRIGGRARTHRAAARRGRGRRAVRRPGA